LTFFCNLISCKQQQLVFAERKMSKDVIFRVGLIAQKNDPTRGVREGFVFSEVYVQSIIRQYFQGGNCGFSGKRLNINLEFGQTFIGSEDGRGFFEPFVKISWHCEDGILQEESDSFANYIRATLGRE